MSGCGTTASCVFHTRNFTLGQPITPLLVHRSGYKLKIGIEFNGALMHLQNSLLAAAIPGDG
jgi:hypothetical protein